MSDRLVAMNYFAYDHLPPNQQEVARPFSELVEAIHARYFEQGGDYSAMSEGLYHLLEAKDAILRSVTNPQKVNSF